jgi:hypothetical protein
MLPAASFPVGAASWITLLGGLLATALWAYYVFR